jgi:hypothetical protein
MQLLRKSTNFWILLKNNNVTRLMEGLNSFDTLEKYLQRLLLNQISSPPGNERCDNAENNIDPNL